MDSILENIPRHYTLIAELMSCWVFFFSYTKKKSVIKMVIYTVLVALLEIIYLNISPLVQQWFWAIHMVILFMFMFIYIKLVCGESNKNVFYYTTKSFLLAEFIAAFEWQIAFYYGWKRLFSSITMTLIAVVFYFVCLLIMFFIDKFFISDEQHIEFSLQEDVIAFSIMIVVFLLSNIGFFTNSTPFSGESLIDLFTIRTISDLMGLVLLYAFHSRISQIEMRNNLAIMDRNLREQYNKYRNYQDGINLINLKYHDLRHQLEDLKAQADGQAQMLLINNIESELREYRPYFQTGNDVLNALLDSRHSLCAMNNITITAVADGNVLDFMNVADICTVIGNSLDNALESVSVIPDEEKRLIHLEIAEQKNFAMIIVENTCESSVEFENGLPKTSHKDKDKHGYGTKSISRVVNKYGGSVVFDQTGDWFSMKILIPR